MSTRSETDCLNSTLNPLVSINLWDVLAIILFMIVWQNQGVQYFSNVLQEIRATASNLLRYR